MIRQLSVFTLILWLTGCALLKVINGPEQSMIMPLAHPVGPSKRIVLQIAVNGLGQPNIMLCVLEMDAQHVAMAGLSNEGLSLFNLSYDGKTIQLDKSPLMADSLAPEAIMADLQLIYWPIEALNKRLAPQWRLESDKNHRYLYYKDDRKVAVNYLSASSTWAEVVDLVNHQYDYNLHITTLNYDAVSE